MSLANILVHVDIDADSSHRVRLAAGLAERFGSTLIGISAAMLPPYPAETAYFVTREFVDQEQQNIIDALKRSENAFRAAAGSNGLNIEWRSSVDLPESYIATEARSADLLIVGRDWLQGDVCRGLDPGAAVLRTGRPMLIVPPGVESMKGERILVAWEESREARRAVCDALPLLCAAAEVFVVNFCEAGTEPAGRRHVDDVDRYLSRHRVPVASTLATSIDGSIAASLVDFARSKNADLIVAGAYGHSRLGEWIFGGVTRDLLKSSPLCCFLAN